MTTQDQADAIQGRRIALVIAATGILWVLIQALGGHFAWPPKYILLVDMSAAAAFVWAMVAAWRIWRRRQR